MDAIWSRVGFQQQENQALHTLSRWCFQSQLKFSLFSWVHIFGQFSYIYLKFLYIQYILMKYIMIQRVWNNTKYEAKNWIIIRRNNLKGELFLVVRVIKENTLCHKKFHTNWFLNGLSIYQFAEYGQSWQDLGCANSPRTSGAGALNRAEIVRCATSLCTNMKTSKPGGT